MIIVIIAVIHILRFQVVHEKNRNLHSNAVFKLIKRYDIVFTSYVARLRLISFI